MSSPRTGRHGSHAPLRVAWIGTISQGGGVAGFGSALVRGLLDRGHDIWLFTSAEPAHLAYLTDSYRNLKVVTAENNWRWNRWYSRDKLSAFVTGTLARSRAYRRLISMLVEKNHANRFDVILQFSQSELFTLARFLPQLPPILLFPCVHAAGELRWHRAESSFARRFEPAWRHFISRAILIHRSRLQRSAFRKVYGVLGMSERFNQLLRQDSGIPAKRQAVIYQPLITACQDSPASTSAPGVIQFVFPARLSVRKGLDLVIELSHRVQDLAGQVEILLAGGATLWSDYSGHLVDLNPAIARSLGSLEHHELISRFAKADAIVLPSKYEPGGIVVAEALSMGCICVVSDEVGSAEKLSEPACRRFRSGDIDDLERAFRKAVADIRLNRESLRLAARREAESRFSEKEAIDRLESTLRAASENRALDDAYVEPALAAASADVH